MIAGPRWVTGTELVLDCSVGLLCGGGDLALTVDAFLLLVYGVLERTRFGLTMSLDLALVAIR